MFNELMVEAAKKTIDMWNWIAENPTVPPGFDSPLVEIANEGISPKLVYFDKHRHLEVPEISLCYLCEAASTKPKKSMPMIFGLSLRFGT